MGLPEQFNWENFANEKTLTLLNDGSATLFSTRLTFTKVDDSMATTHLALPLSWQCLNHDMSDHFPIYIQNTNGSFYNTKYVKRFKDKFADWASFSKNIVELHISIPFPKTKKQQQLERLSEAE